MVGESEREDFGKAIRNKGWDSDDFELTENRNPPQDGGGIYLITGTVTIKRKSTGAQKSYRAGHDSAWPAEFEDDLKLGVFG